MLCYSPSTQEVEEEEEEERPEWNETSANPCQLWERQKKRER